MLANIAGNGYCASHYIPWTLALLSTLGKFMRDPCAPAESQGEMLVGARDTGDIDPDMAQHIDPDMAQLEADLEWADKVETRLSGGAVRSRVLAKRNGAKLPMEPEEDSYGDGSLSD